MHNLEKRLRELRVWTRFQRNVKKLNSKNLKFYEQKDPNVMAAFAWSDSPEGHDFWSNIHRQIKW